MKALSSCSRIDIGTFPRLAVRESGGTWQRIAGVVIQIPDLFHTEPRFFDQQVRARQNCGGQLLDDETHSLRGSVEPLVLGPALGGPAATEEQLRRNIVIEAVVIARLLASVLADTMVRLRLACHRILPALMYAGAYPALAF